MENKSLGEYLKDIETGKLKLHGFPLSHSQGKLVFEEMWDTGKSPTECAFKLGLLKFVYAR